MRHAAVRIASLVLLAALPLATARAQSSGGSTTNRYLHPQPTSRIIDPKLVGGGCRIRYQLDVAPSDYNVTIVALKKGQQIASIFQGREKGSLHVIEHFWDGRDAAGVRVDPGRYTVRVTAGTTTVDYLDYPVDVVRLGITNITADPTNGTNEWQVVYFRKHGAYKFYATPATGEWTSDRVKGEISDLDLDDGSPRPAPAVHTTTDEPVLRQTSAGGWAFDTKYHNYPLCYLAGAQPQFTVTYGTSCTDSSGTKAGCNYPVAGYELCLIARDERGAWTSTDNVNFQAGQTSTFLGPALTKDATRSDRHVQWRFQYRPVGATEWESVPGRFETEHWIYTIVNTPYYASGASGTQYDGPWAELLDDMYQWQGEFDITPHDEAGVVELLIKGFNGQPTLDHAIEDVEYDCPANGGDGGATYYFDGTNVYISRLLNAHALGKYVNCSDCASNTSAMLGMLGVQNVQMMHLGSMTLRAIWGIGCADYTLDIWNNGGGAGHGFSYHHIITRDAGTDISDACLWVDDDGDPDHLPGTPGYTPDRDWKNYEKLLAKGNVTWYLDILPKIQ